MTSVLFCDGPEVDVEDLQGFQAALAAPRATRPARPGHGIADRVRRGGAGTGRGCRRPGDAAARGPRARGRGRGRGRDGRPRPAGEVAGRGPGPGRRSAGGRRRSPRRRAPRAGGHDVSPPVAERRRAADLRRRASLGHLERRRRPSSRTSSGRGPGTRDVCQWAEAGLLAEIESAVPGEPGRRPRCSASRSRRFSAAGPNCCARFRVSARRNCGATPRFRAENVFSLAIRAI